MFYGYPVVTAGCDLINACGTNPNPPPTNPPHLPTQCPTISWQALCQYQGQWVYIWASYIDQNGNTVPFNYFWLIDAVKPRTDIGEYALYGCVERIENGQRRRVKLWIPLSRIYCYLKLP